MNDLNEIEARLKQLKPHTLRSGFKENLLSEMKALDEARLNGEKEAKERKPLQFVNLFVKVAAVFLLALLTVNEIIDQNDKGDVRQIQQLASSTQEHKVDKFSDFEPVSASSQLVDMRDGEVSFRDDGTAIQQLDLHFINHGEWRNRASRRSHRVMQPVTEKVFVQVPVL